MAYRGSQVIVIFVALTALSILVTYGLSVGDGHVTPVLPFAGEIGDQPLESTLFTQCFVVDSALFMLVVQIRYVYASHGCRKIQDASECVRANDAGVYVGYAAAMGLFVVACFQESHAFYVNHLGGCLLFVGTTIYFTCQSVVTAKLAASRSERSTLKARIFLNALMFLFLISFVAGYALALVAFNKPWEDRHHWGKDDGGWVARTTGAASEWILIVLFLIYCLTFYGEFKKVMLTKTKMIVLNEDNQNPTVRT